MRLRTAEEIAVLGLAATLLCSWGCSRIPQVASVNGDPSPAATLPIRSVTLRPSTKNAPKKRKGSTGRQNPRVRVGTANNTLGALAVPTSFVTLGANTYGIYSNSSDAVSSDSATFQGGAVIGTADLQLIFWGSEWNTMSSPSAGDIVGGITRLMATDYFEGMHQYGFVGLHLRDPIQVQSPEPRFGFTFANVGDMVWNLIDQGTFPEPRESGGRILYMVLMPMGSDYFDPNTAGAHDAAADFDFPGGTSYAWVGFSEYGSLADVTKVLTHEIVEAISDPEPNQDRAWVMNRTLNKGVEIGDACNNSFDQLDGVTVQAYWSQALRACVIPFPPAPTLNFITPNSSPPQGGALIRINGTNFDTKGNTQVFFNGVPALGVSCPNTTQCYVTTRSGNGIVDLTVQVNRFKTPVDTVSKFYYYPSVFGLDRSSGNAGDPVIIHGLGISKDSIVNFGSFVVTSIFCTPGQDCTVIVPPGFGTVDVRVTSGQDVSTITPADMFTYTPAGITSMTVNIGSISGGTYTTIYGQGFDPTAGATHQMEVFFGNAKTNYVSCRSSTICDVRSMPGTALGPAHITFSAFGGPRSKPMPTDVFTYVPYGLISIIPFGGGGFVRLNGTAPAGGATVNLASSDPSVLAVGPTVLIPPGAVGAGFSWTPLPTNLHEAVTITASFQGSKVSMIAEVAPWPTVSLSGPDALAANVVGTITISLAAPAGPGGAAVALISEDPTAISVPASVTVPAGTHQLKVSITNHYNGKPRYLKITASFATAVANLTIAIPNEAVCKVKGCPRGFHFDLENCQCEVGLPR